jgi:uncharacterized protein YnzC (UPF0291/DUF896 family)
MDESKQEEGEKSSTVHITGDTSQGPELHIIGNYTFTSKQIEDLARLTPKDCPKYQSMCTLNLRSLTAEEIAEQEALRMQHITTKVDILENHQPSGRCNLGSLTSEEIAEQEALRRQNYASRESSYFDAVQPFQGTAPTETGYFLSPLYRSHPIAVLEDLWASTNGGSITRIDSKSEVVK